MKKKISCIYIYIHTLLHHCCNIYQAATQRRAARQTVVRGTSNTPTIPCEFYMRMARSPYTHTHKHTQTHTNTHTHTHTWDLKYADDSFYMRMARSPCPPFSLSPPPPLSSLPLPSVSIFVEPCVVRENIYICIHSLKISVLCSYIHTHVHIYTHRVYIRLRLYKTFGFTANPPITPSTHHTIHPCLTHRPSTHPSAHQSTHTFKT